MAIRVSNLALFPDQPESSLVQRIASFLGISPSAIGKWRILRKSLDARDKDALRFIYAVEVHLPEDQERIAQLARFRPRTGPRVESYKEEAFEIPGPGGRRLVHRPTIIGSGPAGMVAAYFLAQQGYQPVVLERGRPVRERIHDVRAFDAGGPLDPESNYLFGEGGAGTFSDGKLTCRSSGPDVRWVLQLLADCKGKSTILYDYRPHLGSNRLPAVIKALRQQIEKLGGEFRFSCRVEDFDFQQGKLVGLMTSSGYLKAQVAVLAIGHSARDTYGMCRRRGVAMVSKSFQMGVRIEQPQENINRVQYGQIRWEEKLGAADYSLVARGEPDLFTFCMCAGGNVIPSVSNPGFFCTNGMSLSGRDSPFANSGLMISVDPRWFGEDVFAGIRLQEEYERKAFELGRGQYLCPIQRAQDFLDGRITSSLPECSYRRGVVSASISELVPTMIRQALNRGLPILDKRWKGRFLQSATLVGPEARGSAPVRIERDVRTRETIGIEGLYPVGEGAGYAGGIVSAAVDGLRSAKAIVAKYAPLGEDRAGLSAMAHHDPGRRPPS
jgi:uncharacterized FAD-dependent dehydrogenase